MPTKTRYLLPILLSATILLSVLGGWLWYDATADHSGWVEAEGTIYYQDQDAQPVSGWQDLEDGRYYFNVDGTPKTGWQTIDDITYYFGDTGIMHTGWLELEGKLHYFGANGTMVTGWLWIDLDRYYLQDGALLTGWQTIDGQTHYFAGSGIAVDGWQDIDGKRCYFSDTVLAAGLMDINGQTYYFTEDGTLHTGWLESDQGNRYFAEDGAMVRDWQQFDEGLRYFGDDGILRYDWQDIGENLYYFGSEGIAATGPTQIGGQMRYFSPSGIHVVLVNGLNPVPDWYQPELVSIGENHRVSAQCYDALTRMLSDCTAAGIEYVFNSSYRTVLEQTTILEYRTREHMADFDLEFYDARNMAYQTVAVPGTSEHHLGLAVDLLGDSAVAWLTEHCWDYGFIVRYKAEKESITGIVDEPWHFRYVGYDVAQELKNSGLCLEEYLGAEPVTFDKIQEHYGDDLYSETVWVPPTESTKK